MLVSYGSDVVLSDTQEPGATTIAQQQLIPGLAVDSQVAGAMARGCILCASFSGTDGVDQCGHPPEATGVSPFCDLPADTNSI